MSDKPYTDVIREVAMPGEPVLTIRPWPDDPTGAVELCSLGEEAQQHWGAFSVAMPRALADELGRALIAAAVDSLKK